MGPSPLRRLVQLLCLAGFLVLLFYVTWPYSARPARTWAGLAPLEVDPQSGAALVEADHLDAPPPAGKALTLIDAPPKSADAPPMVLGPFTAERREGRKLALLPAGPLSAEQIQRAAFSLGPWTLHERAPDQWPSHYADDLAAKESVPADLGLLLDPLVAISAALAGRAWLWALAGAGTILLACLIVPRLFCGYLCPLGTLVDLADWAASPLRKKRRDPRQDPRKAFRGLIIPDTPGPSGRFVEKAFRGLLWLRQTRWFLLAIILGAAGAGVMLAGFASAIPIVTRGLVFLVKPVQDGLGRGWHNVPPIQPGQIVSVGMLLAVLALALAGRRVWCRFLCPSGAVFSLLGRFGLVRRRVQTTCTRCGRCRAECSMGAVEEDFSTRPTDCVTCQVCGGVCPAGAITFEVGGSDQAQEEQATPPSKQHVRQGRDSPGRTWGWHQATVPRRDVLRTSAALSLSALGGAGLGWCIRATSAGEESRAGMPALLDLPIRPPGSAAEREFLRLCVRCGQCFRACPNDALQPMGLERGIDSLWTPALKADWSGCERSCSNCGRVCPTGAIRPLALEEKRRTVIGVAVVDCAACLPHAQKEACRLCVDECKAAGYDAIEFINVGTRVDEEGKPIEGSGYLAPVVRADKCVGCGLCQTRCLAVNAQAKKLLERSAIVVRKSGEW